MGVDIVGEGTGRCGPEVREKLVLSIKGNNREREFLTDRSGRGRRGNSSDGCFDDGEREILDWDVCEWDAVNNFLELKVDIGVLSLNSGGILKLWA